MKILRVIATVDPATGGPVAGMRAITPAFARLGHETEFLTVDSPKASHLGKWIAPVHAVGPGRTSYAYAAGLRPWLEQNVNRYDAVVVHGLWQYLGMTVRAVTQAPGRPPYFVFPHGMLDPTLRTVYPVKHVKKWLYWRAIERRVIRDARAVFFTCEEERLLARKSFSRYQCRERVVAYGAAAPEGERPVWKAAWERHCPTIQTRRYFLFLGRLHSKKGVDLLLRAYAKVAREFPTTNGGTAPDLVVAGPCHDETYLASLREIAAKAGVASSVHWPGMIEGDVKWGAISGADAFVLPSHQENFGIAVVEALACGTPALISNRVNIWSELLNDQAALVESDDETGTIRLLQRWLALTPAARSAMSAAARESFRRRFEISYASQNLADQLAELLGKSSTPQTGEPVE